MIDKEKNQKKLQQMGIFITLPFVLAVPPIVGWFIGQFLDKKLDTTPYITYLFLILGIAAGVIEFCRIIKKYGNI